MNRSIAAPRAALFDLLLIGAVATVANVIADSVFEQHCVLGHDSDSGTKLFWVTARAWPSIRI